MKYVLKSDEMKACDNYTISRIGILSMVLMERAALSVVRVLEERNIQFKGKKVLVVSGVGNNGGDGLAIGRLLSPKGAEVTFYLEGNPDKLSKETKAQAEILKNMGFSIQSKYQDAEYDMVVDALFGIGLSREVTGSFREAIDYINRQKMRGAFVCSVDIPSGVCADTGRIFGCAVRADITVSFAFAKRGHLLYPGRACTGELAVRDIGITKEAFGLAAPSGFYYEKEDLRMLLPARCPWGNKGTFGKVLLIAGSRDMSGACLLCGKAVLRAGAGMLKIISPACNREIIQQSLPEALLYTFEEMPEEEAVEEALSWADVVVAGPGMGCTEAAYRLLSCVLANPFHPLVLDADALNLIAGDMSLQILAAGQGEAGRSMILTPHEGELSRLSGKTMEQVREDREHVSRALARDLHCILVCKGARTLVCREQGEICVNLSGDNGMGTAGSGDVLTGVIAALLAQGAEAFEAASVGVYLHGLAGERAARRYGSHGLTAGRLAEAVGEYAALQVLE